MIKELSYHVFISYAHEDSQVALWLHRAFETYRLPSGVRLPTGAAAVIGARPFYPCFLDREELRGGELSEQIADALRHSRNLIVLCSIHSLDSAWVDREVAEFLKTNPVARIFPVLTGDTGGLSEVDLFPKSLRAALGASEGEIGALSLLAIDLRSNGDGAKRGLFKLIAGTSGILFRDLVARQASRERRTRLAWATAAVAATLISVQGIIVSLNRTGNSEMQRRMGIAQEQLEFGNKNAIAFMVGTEAESKEAIYSNPVKCEVGIGGCGYFDEEYGMIFQKFSVGEPDGIHHDTKVDAAFALVVPKVVAGLQRYREMQDRRSEQESAVLRLPDFYPESISRAFGSYFSSNSGTVQTVDGEKFNFSEISVSPRGYFLRRSWVMIWHGSIPDMVRAEALEFWGRMLPLSFFFLFVFAQFASIGRMLRREPR